MRATLLSRSSYATFMSLVVFSSSNTVLLHADTPQSSHMFVLLEYDRGPNSYYYSRSEGSGDGCDPYSDDEDCYDYSEYEGSGSGEDDYYSAGGYDDDDTGDDPSEENYPPWMTTTTKASVVKTRTEDDDIKLDEPRSTSTSLTTKTTSTATAGASGVAPPSPLSAVRALLYFAVPLATCWLGNLFAVPSPSW